MGARKNGYLQNLSERWQNNDKFITIVQCEETFACFVMIPKSISKIDFYLCFVSYYYSQVDKMAIFLSSLHQMIIF